MLTITTAILSWKCSTDLDSSGTGTIIISLFYQVELHVVSSGSEPRLDKQASVRCGRAGDPPKIGTTGEAEHRALAVPRDRSDGRDHVAHTRRGRRDEEHAEIVYAEMIVDHAVIAQSPGVTRQLEWGCRRA